jgi:hypothetical protein
MSHHLVQTWTWVIPHRHHNWRVKWDSVSILTMQINQWLEEPDGWTLDRWLLTLMGTSLTNEAVTGTEQQVSVSFRHMREHVKGVTIYLERDRSREDRILKEDAPVGVMEVGHCKGTSICFLTSPLLSYSPLFIYTSPTPLYHLQGPHSKSNDFCRYTIGTISMCRLK